MDEEALCELCGSGGGAECLLLCENHGNQKIRCNSGRHFYCFDPEYASLLTKEEANKFIYFCWGCSPYADTDSADETGDLQQGVTSPKAARPARRRRKKKQQSGSDSDSTYSPPSDDEEGTAHDMTAQSSQLDTVTTTTNVSETQDLRANNAVQPQRQTAKKGDAVKVKAETVAAAPSKAAKVVTSPPRTTGASDSHRKRGSGKMSQAVRAEPSRRPTGPGTRVKPPGDPILKMLKAQKSGAAHAVPTGQLLKPPTLEATGNLDEVAREVAEPERPPKRPRVEASAAANDTKPPVPKPMPPSRPKVEADGQNSQLARQGSGSLPKPAPPTNKLNASTASVLKRSAGAAKPVTEPQQPWSDMLAEPPEKPETHRLWMGKLGWPPPSGGWVEFEAHMLVRRFKSSQRSVVQQLQQTQAAAQQLKAPDSQLRPSVMPTNQIPSSTKFKIDEVANRVTVEENDGGTPDMVKITLRPGGRNQPKQDEEFALSVRELYKRQLCLFISVEVDGKQTELYLLPRIPKTADNYLLVVSIAKQPQQLPGPPSLPNVIPKLLVHTMLSGALPNFPAAAHSLQTNDPSQHFAAVVPAGASNHASLQNGYHTQGLAAAPLPPPPPLPAPGGRQKDPRRDLLLQNPSVPTTISHSPSRLNGPSSLPLPSSPLVRDRAKESGIHIPIPSYTIQDPNECVFEMKSFHSSQPTAETGRLYVRASAYSSFFTEQSKKLVCGEFSMQGMVAKLQDVPDWALYEYMYPSKEHFIESLVKNGLVGMYWSLTLGQEVCALMEWFPRAKEVVLPKVLVILPDRLIKSAPPGSGHPARANHESPPTSPLPVDLLQRSHHHPVKQEPAVITAAPTPQSLPLPPHAITAPPAKPELYNMNPNPATSENPGAVHGYPHASHAPHSHLSDHPPTAQRIAQQHPSPPTSHGTAAGGQVGPSASTSIPLDLFLQHGESTFAHGTPPDIHGHKAAKHTTSAIVAPGHQHIQKAKSGALQTSPSIDPAAPESLLTCFVNSRQERVLNLLHGLERMKKLPLTGLKICLVNVHKGVNDWATGEVMDKLANATQYHNIQVLMFPNQDELPYDTLRRVNNAQIVLIPSCRLDEPLVTWQLATTIPLKNWLCYEVLFVEEPLAGPVTYPERVKESFLELISKPESTKITAGVWSRSKLFDKGVSVVTDAATLMSAEPRLALELLDTLDTAAEKVSGKFELHIRRDEWSKLQPGLPPAVYQRMEGLINSAVPRIHLINNASPSPAQETLVEDAVHLLHNKDQPRQRAKNYRLVIAMHSQNASADLKDRIAQHTAILGGHVAEVAQFVHLLVSGLMNSTQQ